MKADSEMNVAPYRNVLIGIASRLVDLLYPSNIYCISCNAIIDNTRPYSLCDTCIRTMNWANKRSCNKCGKILREGYLPSLCTDCSVIKHSFEKAFACAEYGRGEREIIHNFKYKDKAYIGRKLAELMKDRMETEDLELNMILPVPMYKRKAKKRGYNQAAVLAYALSKTMKIPWNGHVLVRNIDTEPMSNLGAEERRNNINGAFEINKKWVKNIQGKTLLLVDDVYTTGSTADACTNVLLRAGAQKVYVLVFASGANI